MTILHLLGAALSIAFAAFMLWMLIDCIKNVEDKEDRVIWALFILFIGLLFAPVYFVQRYLPRRQEVKKELSRDA